MSRVKIVTDSTSDLDAGVAEELGITIVPLEVFFGDESFKDHFEISSKQFFEKLVSSEHHPRTSQPSPEAFREVYEELAGDGASVVSVHISSDLSGTYASAVMARDVLAERRPELDITVIDSRSGSLGLGVPVMLAARAAMEGASVETIKGGLEEVFQRQLVTFAVDTLKYLERNGRIGKAQAMLGGLLKVKPVLFLENGIVSPLDKVRGKKKVIPALISAAKERVDFISEPLIIGILHGNAEDDAAELLAVAQGEFDVISSYIGELGPVIGTHVGPGTLGLCVTPNLGWGK